MRLLALDGTVSTLPDTPSNRESFRYSTDDELSHSPFPQARLVLVVECATHLICDAEISPCRQAEASSTRLLLERGQWEHTLVLWDSGFHCSGAIFQLRASGGHVLGRLKSNVLLKPCYRLSARPLLSLTANGVIQELYALLLAHTLVRTLMLRAAQPQGLAPTTISFTDTIRLVDDSLVPLSLVSSARRQQMVGSLLQELGTFRLPKQQVRIQARVVKRVRSRYERKKPEHWQAPPLEWDLDFHQILALVV